MSARLKDLEMKRILLLVTCLFSCLTSANEVDLTFSKFLEEPSSSSFETLRSIFMKSRAAYLAEVPDVVTQEDIADCVTVLSDNTIFTMVKSAVVDETETLAYVPIQIQARYKIQNSTPSYGPLLLGDEAKYKEIGKVILGSNCKLSYISPACSTPDHEYITFFPEAAVKKAEHLNGSLTQEYPASNTLMNLRIFETDKESFLLYNIQKKEKNDLINQNFGYCFFKPTN